jgi:hypothetical protein
MVEKRLQGHDFENGGPVKQYEFNFTIEDGTLNGGYLLGVDAADDGVISFTTTQNHYPLYVQNSDGEDSLVITGNNNIVLGNGITVPDDSTNTTYINNLHVQGTITSEPSEGDMRFNAEHHRMMYYINGTWNFIEENHHVTGNGYRRLDTLIPVRGESRWVRFKKWVSNIFY